MDADGCDDLIAYDDDTLAVFYGGKSRFQKPRKLSARDADAILTGPSWPQKLSDLDGDGADEILFALDGGLEFKCSMDRASAGRESVCSRPS